MAAETQHEVEVLLRLPTAANDTLTDLVRRKAGPTPSDVVTKLLLALLPEWRRLQVERQQYLNTVNDLSGRIHLLEDAISNRAQVASDASTSSDGGHADVQADDPVDEQDVPLPALGRRFFKPIRELDPSARRKRKAKFIRGLMELASSYGIDVPYLQEVVAGLGTAHATGHGQGHGVAVGQTATDGQGNVAPGDHAHLPVGILSAAAASQSAQYHDRPGRADGLTGPAGPGQAPGCATAQEQPLAPRTQATGQKRGRGTAPEPTTGVGTRSRRTAAAQGEVAEAGAGESTELHGASSGEAVATASQPHDYAVDEPAPAAAAPVLQVSAPYTGSRSRRTGPGVSGTGLAVPLSTTASTPMFTPDAAAALHAIGGQRLASLVPASLAPPLPVDRVNTEPGQASTAGRPAAVHHTNPAAPAPTPHTATRPGLVSPPFHVSADAIAAAGGFVMDLDSAQSAKAMDSSSARSRGTATGQAKHGSVQHQTPFVMMDLDSAKSRDTAAAFKGGLRAHDMRRTAASGGAAGDEVACPAGAGRDAPDGLRPYASGGKIRPVPPDAALHGDDHPQQEVEPSAGTVPGAGKAVHGKLRAPAAVAAAQATGPGLDDSTDGPFHSGRSVRTDSSGEAASALTSLTAAGLPGLGLAADGGQQPPVDSTAASSIAGAAQGQARRANLLTIDTGHGGLASPHGVQPGPLSVALGLHAVGPGPAGMGSQAYGLPSTLPPASSLQLEPIKGFMPTAVVAGHGDSLAGRGNGLPVKGFTSGQASAGVVAAGGGNVGAGAAATGSAGHPGAKPSAVAPPWGLSSARTAMAGAVLGKGTMAVLNFGSGGAEGSSNGTHRHSGMHGTGHEHAMSGAGGHGGQAALASVAAPPAAQLPYVQAPPPPASLHCLVSPLGFVPHSSAAGGIQPGHRPVAAGQGSNSPARGVCLMTAGPAPASIAPGSSGAAVGAREGIGHGGAADHGRSHSLAVGPGLGSTGSVSASSGGALQPLGLRYPGMPLGGIGIGAPQAHGRYATGVPGPHSSSSRSSSPLRHADGPGFGFVLGLDDEDEPLDF